MLITKNDENIVCVNSDREPVKYLLRHKIKYDDEITEHQKKRLVHEKWAKDDFVVHTAIVCPFEKTDKLIFFIIMKNFFYLFNN